ncbi:MAG: hypothetical protein Q8934_08860 [Bacillota bacterium]|nr:hypothetical protein [Bacillota bacterium]
MSIIIPTYMSKEQLKRINEKIPVSKRSRLMSQFILENEYTLPTTKNGLQKIIEWEQEEEKVILPIFFSEEAARIIDDHVQKLKKEMVKHKLQAYVGRSTIIRAILDNFADFVEAHPIEESEKQFILIHMPEGTKEKLDSHIDKMERSHTIDFFLSEEYEKPAVGVESLKARLKGEKEKLPLYLGLESLEKAERIAESYGGQKVKKTHIIRDAIFRLMDRLDIENPKKKELEKTLERTLDEIIKHSNPEEINEILAKYNIKD